MGWVGRLCLAGVLFVACTSSSGPNPILEGEELPDGSIAPGTVFYPGGTAEGSGIDTEAPDASVSDQPGGAPARAAASANPPSPGTTGVGTTAPTGIASTPGVPAPTSGAGPAGRDDAACAAMERAYAAALVRATACDFFALGPTCQLDAEVSLACPGCRVSVQDPRELVVLRDQWRSFGCDGRGRDCPALACTNLERGLCVPRGAAGVCDGTTLVAPSL